MRLTGLAPLVAASVAAVAGPALAAELPLKAPIPQALAPASGYVEVYTAGAGDEDKYQNTFLGANDLKYNGWLLGGAGRGNWWATANISMQLDAQGEGTQYSVPSSLLAPGFSGKFSTSNYLIGAHANWRDQQRGLIGIFGGIGDAGGNVATGTFSNTGIRHGLIGGEGQYYLGPLTVYGQGGYDSTVTSGNIAIFSKVDAWFGRGTGRYFITPDVMIEGTAQYDAGTISRTFGGMNQNYTMWLWRAKAEWKPSALPFSLFAAYEGARTNYGVFGGTVSEQVTDNRAVVGLRLYLGQNTLLANDRTGATLDILDPLGAPTSPVMLFANGQAFFVSDARLKRDIARIGRLDNGLGLYRYHYLWSDTEYVGVMAQEVAAVVPDAVLRGPDGYLRVNYSRLGLRLQTWDEWAAAH